ncbi:MAG TPA: aspartyl protease family protein [Wenzhouxiangellaceae bacterium]|nr:aspartyl protease family protein [Wenzhouxiangellaceae bacterium]
MSVQIEARSPAVRRGAIRLLAFIILAHASLLVAQQPDEAAWMAFAEGESRPAVEVVINGKKTTALIDTSISANAISYQFAREAGIEPGPRSLSLPDIQDGEQLPLSSTFTLELGGNPVELDSAVMIPAEDIGLIVGRPLLNALVVQIDYPNRRLRFMPADMGRFEGNVKLRRGRFNQPMVVAQVNRKRVWMNLDTSSDTVTLLTDRIVDKHGWQGEEIGADQLQAAGLTVRPDVRAMRLDELELGPYKIEGVVAAAPVEGRERSTGYGAHRISEKFGGDGILGHEVMRNFLVTIALGTDNVHFYAE